MKICRRGLYAQLIDNQEGTVRACSWAGYYILGNLKENSLLEVYNSEAGQRFRQSLLDGTYDFCNEENCPWMANGTLEEEMVEVDEIPPYPQMLSLAYDRRCNYHCTCCISRGDKKPDAEMQSKIESEICKALPYVKDFSANGLGEFFVSDSMLRVVSEWKPEQIENALFTLETNGSLFTPENWNKISNIGRANLWVAVTVHSFENTAYQLLSGTKYPVDKVIENLKFMKELREAGAINHLEIATVLQERNFRTLPNFVERCLNEFGADSVRVRRFLPEKAMDENIEWFFDIRNPLHPYHQEYLEVMKHPIFKDPRVFVWTGDHLSNRGEIPAKANYEAMRALFLTDDVGKKLSDALIARGYSQIALYAATDVGKALMKVLKGQAVAVECVYDRNTPLTQWEGLEVKKPTNENLKKLELPLLVTLVPRHGEMEEFLRNHGYEGEILSLKELLNDIQ